MRALPLVLVVLATAVDRRAVAAPGPTAATATDKGADYAIANTSWNGLSQLAAIASSAGGMTMVEETELDWKDVTDSDVLFFVYPTSRVDAVQLAAFLRHGGRALIADDFGKGDEALARLGILRHDAQGVHAARFWNSNPALPIALPTGNQPLAHKSTELVTNHPSVFSVAPGPDIVYEFGKGEAVVVAGDLDDGRFVALADPSVLINGMLAFQGNLAFAVNLVKFLTPTAASARPGRIIVLTSEFRLDGEPPGALDNPKNSSMNGILGDLGKFFDELNDYVAPADGLRNGARAAGLVALLIGLGYAIFRRVRDPDAGFARVDPVRAGFEAAVEDFDRRRSSNFALPAAALRENVDAKLVELVGPDADLPAAALAKKLEAARLLRVPAADAQRLLERLRQVPPRQTLLARPYQVAERDFIDLQDSVAATFTSVTPQKDDHGHPGN